MGKKRINGRIIRILDTRTVVINLGSKDGIENDSVFHILGELESVIDPVTNEKLGTVKVAKSRVRASQVFDRFTVATTSWTNTYFELGELSRLLGGYSGFSGKTRTENVDEGELFVDPEEIQPWKAKSESPVKVGDEVEVEVEVPETARSTTQEAPQPQAAPSAASDANESSTS